MSMIQHKPRKAMSDINVVPYIDVMLVLLVIFMITAPMLNQGIEVNLPKTASEPMQSKKDDEPIVVSVDSNGAYFMDSGETPDKPMALSDLQARVGKIIAERPQAEVLVRGDQHVAYGVIVELMASLQTAGASKVGLITEKPRS
ncbi:protein TolR [Marinobacteraceae bacterium S3BR75-40.1]